MDALRYARHIKPKPPSYWWRVKEYFATLWLALRGKVRADDFYDY